MRLRNIPGADAAVAACPYVIQNPSEKKGNWDNCFAKKQPIHIEVGMGKGQFIFQMAKLHPDRNYIGIERYTSVLLRAIQKLDEEDLTNNLLFLCIDAKELPDIFAADEIDRIYLNFSDPWPKDRHAKRRLTSAEFLARYDQILQPTGTIEFKTDNRGLFDFSLDQIRESDIWKLDAYTFDLHQDVDMNTGNVMTEYEEKFLSIGNPICKLIASRK